jgi:uncharacterized membrane protein YdjX (TVP38/TMEM64 family)
VDLTATVLGDPLAQYALLFAVVFGINLLPAFGPPTWSVIVLFALNSDLPPPGFVLTGAAAAASGRFLLAHGFRWLGNRVSQKTRDNLVAAREAFERRKASGILGLGLFALSPVPSAQLFAAIGLAGVRILPFTAAFFAGRLVSYSIYAGSAHVLEEYTLGDAFMETLTSPLGIALQVVMLAGLVALAKVNWAKILAPKD